MFKQKREDLLKLCTLSGTNEVGRNSSFVEYGNDILVVDCGFSFPGEEMYGIDYLIPNTKYLVQKKKNIKGIVITHGHLDHIGALTYVLEELNFPTIYAGEFARALIEEKLKETNIAKRVKIVTVRAQENIQLGVFKCRFVEVSHSVPDSFCIYIQSPKGSMLFSGDYKIDERTKIEYLKELGGKVDIALLESTYSNKPGKSMSESAAAVNLERVITAHKGRVIVAAFASLVSRLASLIEIAKKTNRKILVSGRGFQTIMRIATEKRYIEVPKGIVISDREINKYPDSQLLIITTGAQAERYAALNRISLGEHKTVKAKPGDLVIMSSSEIPENILQISKMTDRLIKQGVDLIKNTEEDVHASGHGMQDDMKMFYGYLQPKFVMPIHGNLTMRYQSKKNYVNWGHNPDKVILTEDGQAWVFDGQVLRKGENIESRPILIDGLGTRDTGDIVLRDRKQLAEYGFFNITINIQQATKKIIGRPKFMSRGFIYMKTGQQLLKEIETIVVDTHREWIRSKRKDMSELTDEIEKRVGKHIFKKTEREPIILTSII